MAGRLHTAQIVVYLLLALTVSACQPSLADVRQYELQGQILAIRPDTHEVLIKHGDIKNFMPAMTMPYKVHDPRLLAGKAAGDLVSARLTVAQDEAWLETLDKTGTAPLESAPAIPPASFVTPVAPGDPIPDATLTADDGSPLTMSGLRGTAVAVTFIYIRCPLPQFCPMMDRRFVDVQRNVLADPVLKSKVRLVSVSFAPEHDTPAAMKAHAVTLNADPVIWHFATAPPEVVDRFAAACGVNVIRERDGTTITHNLRTVIVGPDGRVVSVYDGGEWTAAQAVDDLRRALTPR